MGEQELFEAEYAKAAGLKPLELKMQRAATGMYRDPEITRAARAWKVRGEPRRAA